MNLTVLFLYIIISSFPRKIKTIHEFVAFYENFRGKY